MEMKMKIQTWCLFCCLFSVNAARYHAYYYDNQLDLYRRKSSNVRTARFNAGDKEEANLKMHTLSFLILYVLVSKPVMQKENVKQPNKPFFS